MLPTCHQSTDDELIYLVQRVYPKVLTMAPKHSGDTCTPAVDDKAR